MTNDTQKLIDKYNKSVQSIQEQELAIDKVKQKIESIKNGDIVPQSLKKLDSRLNRTDKEIINIDNKINKLFSKPSKNIDEEIDLKMLQKSKEQLLQIHSELNDTFSIGTNDEIKNLNLELNLMNNKLNDTKISTSELGKQINESLNQKHFDLFGGKIDDVGKKIDKFKNKISRLVGSAMVFSLLRNQLTSLRNDLISLLKTDNQFATSLNQVKANLMTSFAPIYNACLPAINSLMNALSRVTGTIALFVSNLLGGGIKNATKDAKKLSNALNKVNGSAKKASGSLGSFDTLEVIPDTNSSGGVSSNNNQIDYSGEISYNQGLLDVMQAIADFVVKNKDYVLGFLGGIVAGLLIFKSTLDLILALGIGTAVAGLIILIEGVIGYLNDPSWNNFGKVITGLGLIVGGVALAFGAWPIAVAGAVAAVLGIIISNWESIKSFLQGGIDWLKTAGRDLFKFLFGESILPLYDAIVDIIQSALTYLDEQFTFAKDIFNNLIEFIKNVFTGNWANAWENVKNIFFDILKMLLSKLKFALTTIGDLVVGLGKSTGNVIANVFKAVINGMLHTIETFLNNPIYAVNELIKVINKVPGINIGTLPTFKLPRLAKGAVIPPRQEFAAILGDQKHGTNIEAPLDTIKQANREVLEEVLGRIGINGQDREIVLKNWQFILQFGNTTLGKIVIDEIRKYEKETGTQFLLA